MPADPKIQIRSVVRLNFPDSALQRLQDLVVGALNPFMRETGEGLNRLDRWVDVPSSVAAAGAPGDYAADASYFYVCIADNTWRRVALATW